MFWYSCDLESFQAIRVFLKQRRKILLRVFHGYAFALSLVRLNAKINDFDQLRAVSRIVGLLDL